MRLGARFWHRVEHYRVLQRVLVLAVPPHSTCQECSGYGERVRKPL